MKTLMLLRHAEASASPRYSDIERPLTQSGIDYIQTRLTPALVQARLYPDYIFCSPATRTRQTFSHLMPQDAPAAQTVYEDKIYNAATGDLFSVLCQAPDEAETLLMVGHNPGIYGLVGYLTGATTIDAATQNLVLMQYRPGTLAVFDCPVTSWKALQPHENILKKVVTPGFDLAQRSS